MLRNTSKKEPILALAGDHDRHDLEQTYGTSHLLTLKNTLSNSKK